jgi:hypothetical protein
MKANGPHNLKIKIKKVAHASRYPAEVQEHGGKVAVFNTRRSKGDTDADFCFSGL